MQFHIVIIAMQGDQRIGFYHFDANSPKILKIGRLASAQIQLNNHRVSRVHAIIDRTLRGLTLVDMGSPTGTMLNGTKISKAPINVGDIIEIGDITLLVADPQSALENEALPGKSNSQTIPTTTFPASISPSAVASPSPITQPGAQHNIAPVPVTSNLVNNPNTHSAPTYQSQTNVPRVAPFSAPQAILPTASTQQASMPSSMPNTPAQSILISPQNTTLSTSLSESNQNLSQEELSLIQKLRQLTPDKFWQVNGYVSSLLDMGTATLSPLAQKTSSDYQDDDTDFVLKMHRSHRQNQRRVLLLVTLGFILIGGTFAYFEYESYHATSEEFQPSSLINSSKTPSLQSKGREIQTLAAKNKKRIHKVQAGQTLGSIAKTYYDSPSQYKKIFNANQDKLNDPSGLEVGMELTIPP